MGDGPWPATGRGRKPMKQGLTEYAIVTAFLALAVAGAIALFGDELRTALGIAPPAASGAPARPAGRPAP